MSHTEWEIFSEIFLFPHIWSDDHLRYEAATNHVVLTSILTLFIYISIYLYVSLSVTYIMARTSCTVLPRWMENLL